MIYPATTTLCKHLVTIQNVDKRFCPPMESSDNFKYYIFFKHTIAHGTYEYCTYCTYCTYFLHMKNNLYMISLQKHKNSIYVELNSTHHNPGFDYFEASHVYINKMLRRFHGYFI